MTVPTTILAPKNTLYSFQTSYIFFFFNDTATTEIYTLSLHDALPIFNPLLKPNRIGMLVTLVRDDEERHALEAVERSEEHTSELQSRRDLVCRLLLEKKKKNDRAIMR